MITDFVKNHKPKIAAVKSELLSSFSDERYVIVNTETGEILDDAQRYGYKTAQNAHRAFSYKQKHPKPYSYKINPCKKIVRWFKDHKDLYEDLKAVMFIHIKEGTQFAYKDMEAYLNHYEVNYEPFTTKNMYDTFMLMKE